MKKSVEVRKMEKEDIDTVSALWTKLAIDQMKQDEYYMKDVGDLSNFNCYDYYRDCMNNENCCIYVIALNEEIVGFSEVWLYSKDFYFNICDYAYILHFFVEEKVRKTRFAYIVATDLFEATQNWALCHNCSYIGADVFAFNGQVQKLLEYEHLSQYRIRYMKKLN